MKSRRSEEDAGGFMIVESLTGAVSVAERADKVCGMPETHWRIVCLLSFMQIGLRRP
jgi:hypothetical protein